MAVCLLKGPYVLIDGDHRTVPERSKRLLVLPAIRHCEAGARPRSSSGEGRATTSSRQSAVGDMAATLRGG